jgi:hypothetical protein
MYSIHLLYNESQRGLNDDVRCGQGVGCAAADAEVHEVLEPPILRRLGALPRFVFAGHIIIVRPWNMSCF